MLLMLFGGNFLVKFHFLPIKPDVLVAIVGTFTLLPSVCSVIMAALDHTSHVC